MKTFRAVLARELARLFAHKGLLFLVAAWPLLYGVVLGGIYAGRVVVRMPVALLDQDNTARSRAVTRSLEASRSFRVAYRVASVDELRDLLWRNQVAAGVVLPRGLARDVKRGGAGVVTAYVGGANLLTANLALAELRTVFAALAAEARIEFLRDRGAGKAKALAAQQPVQLDIARLYNPGYNYLNYLAPGVWFAALHQILMLLGALLIARELDLGTFRDLARAAGDRAWPLILGKVAPYLAAGFLLLELFLRGFFPFFGIELAGNVSFMVVYSMLFTAATLSCGVFLSALLGTGINAIKGVLLLAAPAFLVSGYTWPLDTMPSALQWLAQVIPLTPYLGGFRKLYQMGAGPGDVLGESLSLLGLTVVFLSLAAWLVARRLRREAA